MKKMQKSIHILGTSIGSAIEYYDFVIYIMLIQYLNTVFFPNDSSIISTLKSLSIFASGYIIRPLGGLIFGSIGDRFGRKVSFTYSILLMASSTLLLGLLPSYNQIGILSSILLLFCRLLQGISQGAELPSAITYITEHHPKQKGYYSGVIFFGITTGSVLSALIAHLITNFFSETEIVIWGWRIPFLLGSALGFIAFYFRIKFCETPQFLKLNLPHTNKPILFTFKKYYNNILLGTFFTLPAACFIIFILFLPSYLFNIYGYSKNQIHLVNSIGMIWAGILVPLFGKLYDKGSKRTILTYTLTVSTIILYLLFKLIDKENLFNLILFVFIFQTLIASLTACYPALLSEAFPPIIRNTGVGVSYNVAYFSASIIPFLCTLVYYFTTSPQSISFIFMVINTISLIMINLKNKPCKKAKLSFK